MPGLGPPRNSRTDDYKTGRSLFLMLFIRVLSFFEGVVAVIAFAVLRVEGSSAIFAQSILLRVRATSLPCRLLRQLHTLGFGFHRDFVTVNQKHDCAHPLSEAFTLHTLG